MDPQNEPLKNISTDFIIVFPTDFWYCCNCFKIVSYFYVTVFLLFSYCSLSVFFAVWGSLYGTSFIGHHCMLYFCVVVCIACVFLCIFSVFAVYYGVWLCTIAYALCIMFYLCVLPVYDGVLLCMPLVYYCVLLCMCCYSGVLIVYYVWRILCVLCILCIIRVFGFGVLCLGLIMHTLLFSGSIYVPFCRVQLLFFCFGQWG